MDQQQDRGSPGGTAGTGEPDATPDFPTSGSATPGESPIGDDPKRNSGDPALNRGGKLTSEGTGAAGAAGESGGGAPSGGDVGGMGGAGGGASGHDRPNGGVSPMDAESGG
ncbi:MAG: hypothetical protein ACK4K7_13065 [Allosphingosinicella sp.]|uniref:hypothetical protein n=1 Tax=Allosphingosinicella sp. TaxID=2823234 RepID=UPI0039215B21